MVKTRGGRHDAPPGRSCPKSAFRPVRTSCASCHRDLTKAAEVVTPGETITVGYATSALHRPLTEAPGSKLERTFLGLRLVRFASSAAAAVRRQTGPLFGRLVVGVTYAHEPTAAP